MPKTYEPIATTTTTGNASTVTFSSIPGTYTDLVLLVNFGTASNVVVNLAINNDTATNYSWTRLIGNGSSAASARSSNNASFNLNSGLAVPTGVTGIVVAQFLSYANTNVFKTALVQNANPGSGVAVRVHLWRSTSAITNLEFSTTNNFTNGSTFSLYGIKAA